MATTSITTHKPTAEAIKQAILHGQYEAAKGVNNIQLAVYFAIGKYISLTPERASGERAHWMPLVRYCVGNYLGLKDSLFQA